MISDDLRRVAAWHLKCADVNAAKAAQAEHQDEKRNAATFLARAEGHRSYATICEDAAGKLSTKAKRTAFEPPTFQEVLAFVRASKMPWPEVDARSWFDHFESNGWKVSGIARMADWKAAARNGFRRWQKDAGKTGATAAGTLQDPMLWDDFLRQHPKHPRTHFRYAKGYVQAEFAKWLKEK